MEKFKDADAREIAEHILPKEVIGHNAAINKALSLGRMLTQDELTEVAQQYNSDARLLKLAVLAFLESIDMLKYPDPASNYVYSGGRYLNYNLYKSFYEEAMRFYLTDKDAYEAFISKNNNLEEPVPK